MKKKSEFVSYVEELLEPFGSIRTRAMFGGYGVYCDDLFLAIIVDQTLYFKTNERTRSVFIKKGCKPFSYESRGKNVSMAYYEAPIEAMDSSDAIAPWVKLAVKAARK